MAVLTEKQNIQAVFKGSQFSIDFYQRDYKWTEAPVKRLLEDIFFKFNEAYENNKDSPPDPKTIDRYPWYYLNTYVTNKVDGKIFIVDGQQRLTTLSLIAIAVCHLAEEMSISKNPINWINTTIAGPVASGQKFWMEHEGHHETQQAIYENTISPEVSNELSKKGITSKNMIDNFEIIKKFFEKEFDSNGHKLETFIYYYMERLTLIELAVEQPDVPMIFEVINDRGMKLNPYEILKGKLLGQIKKDLLTEKKYNELWDDAINSINEHNKEQSSDEADDFFRNYFKAKFANSRGEGQNFDGDYHRKIFTSEFQKRLPLAHNEKEVLKFLDKPFKYFSRLYVKCLEGHESNSTLGFLYNKAVDIDGASMLVMSACAEDDPKEEEKLKRIPLELDRLYSLLQLQGAYDSNAFQEMLYRISENIREKTVEEIRPAFDSQLIAELEERRSTAIKEPFQEKYFSEIGDTLNKRFKRYFLARVEEFFAKNTGQNMMYSIYDLTRKTGEKDGFHIEHILSDNKENKALFNNDDDLFEKMRNRLGALLLLKGKDNKSSGNEPFSKKLKTYSGALIWNQTLTDAFYKSNIDLRTLNDKFGLSLEAMDIFGAEEVKKRQEILFKIAKEIWK